MNENMIEQIDRLMSLIDGASAGEPTLLEMGKVYTVRTLSGSLYTYNSQEDTLTWESESMGTKTTRGHFIGTEGYPGLVPAQIAVGMRVALLYQDDDGIMRCISTSGATEIIVESALDN